MHVIENYCDRDTIRALQKLLRKKFNEDIDFIADNGITALTFAASLGNQDIAGLIF